MEEKLYLDHIDIMNKFHCGKDRAYAIIRAIKSVSDTLKLEGKVTKVDFEVWFNMPLQVQEKRQCHTLQQDTV